jgi:hypothetical protein
VIIASAGGGCQVIFYMAFEKHSIDPYSCAFKFEYSQQPGTHLESDPVLSLFLEAAGTADLRPAVLNAS